MNDQITKEAQATKLDPEELSKVAGGYVYGSGEDRSKPWEVINDYDGSVLARFATKEEAVQAAQIYGQKELEISSNDLNMIRVLYSLSQNS